MTLPELEQWLWGAAYILNGPVDDIDDVVKVVRFDNWQWTNNGEREVKAELRIIKV